MTLPRPLSGWYNWYHHAGLQTRALTAIGVVFAVLLVTLLVTSRVFVMDSLHSIEQAMARNSAEQVRAGLASVEHRLAATAADWATWDDTYRFATTSAPAYIDENLTVASFKNLQVNLMLFLDRAGRRDPGGGALAGFAGNQTSAGTGPHPVLTRTALGPAGLPHGGQRRRHPHYARQSR
jgi:hypothetical protein